MRVHGDREYGTAKLSDESVERNKTGEKEREE